MLDGEHLAGAPETRLHLVGDEQDAERLAPLVDRLEEPRRRGRVATFAEDRLDDHRRGLARRRHHREEVVEPGDRPLDLGRHIVGAHVGVRGDEHTRRQGRVTGAVPGLRRGHRHRLMRPSVEAALEHDDVRPTGRLLGELDRRLGDLGAGVGVEERVDAVRGEFGETRRERLHQVVRVHVGLRVDEPLRLFGDRLGHVRVGVAGGRDRDPAAEVEVALAGRGRDPRSLTRRDLEIGHLEPHVRQVVRVHRTILTRSPPPAIEALATATRQPSRRSTTEPRRDGRPVRASTRSACDIAAIEPLMPSHRSGSGSHRRERRSTHGSAVSSDGRPRMRSARVRPARFGRGHPLADVPARPGDARRHDRSRPRPASRAARRAPRPTGG